MFSLLHRIVNRLDYFDRWVSAALVLSALAIVCAIYALVRQRGLGGLLALLLASLAAGAGIVGQVRAEHHVERSLSERALPRKEALRGSPWKGALIVGPDTPAELERERRARLPQAQELGRVGVLAAILPLLLGAIAALRRPVGARALTAGFLGIAVLCWLGALFISRRPLPLDDRYDFAPDDDDAWKLAVVIDKVREPEKFHLLSGVECRVLGETLDPYWGASDKREWPRVMRKPVPSQLEKAWRGEADRCVQKSLAEMRFLDSVPAAQLREELLASVLLQDEALHARVVGWAPPPPRTAAEREEANRKLERIFGPARTGGLEALFGRADGGQ